MMVRVNRIPMPTPGSLAREMDRLMQSFLRPGVLPLPTFTEAERPFPPLNVWEEGDAVFVEAELPGFTMDRLEVTIVGNELTIAGERPETKLPEDGVYHRRERRAGRFTRTLTLTVPINVDAVTAEMSNGVLLVRLPKAETARPRKIEVKAK
jgi:HSP20 family protein